MITSLLLRRGLLLLAAMAFGAALASPPPAAPTAADALRAERGRLIYETGRRADGSRVLAQRSGLGPVPAQATACMGCHRRSTLGDREAQLLVPPLAGDVLFAPMQRRSLVRAHQVLARQELRAFERPAYSVHLLARALRRGTDAGGRDLNPAMPRYALTNRDVDDLAAHLRAVSARRPDGIDDQQMHVATVVTPQAAARVRDTVETTMAAWARTARFGGRKLQWQLWAVHGPQATWPAQLQAYWQRQPVFALVSGAGGTDWSAVAAFCEARNLPCVFPSLERAPADASRRHASLYLSGGVDAEASLIAGWLATSAAATAPARLHSLSGPHDTSAAAATQALRRALRAHKTTVQGLSADVATLARRINALAGDEAAMLWLRPDAANALFRQASPPAGKRVWLSATLAPPHLVAVPVAWQAHVAWASLHSSAVRRQAGGALSAAPWANALGLPDTLDPVVLADVHAATFFFGDAMARMREGLSADYLLERLEAAVDLRPAGAGYFRLSLAPGQRIAAQGGHVLSFVASTPPRLEPLGNFLQAPPLAD